MSDKLGFFRWISEKIGVAITVLLVLGVVLLIPVGVNKLGENIFSKEFGIIFAILGSLSLSTGLILLIVKEIKSQHRQKDSKKDICSVLDKEALRQDINNFRSESIDFVKKANEVIEEVSAANLTVLTGFDEIFSKASEIISDAEREIWYICFTPDFGTAHHVNEENNKAYCFKKGLDYSQRLEEEKDESEQEYYKKHFGKAIGKFKRAFLEKIDRVNSDDYVKEFNMLTLTTESSNNKLEEIPYVKEFLLQIKERSKYNLLNENDALKSALEFKKSILNSANTRTNKGAGGFECYEIDQLPLQMIIVGINNPFSTIKKYGCLVFMVGTDYIKGVEPGFEGGFYTERHEITTIYRCIARSMVKKAKEEGRKVFPVS